MNKPQKTILTILGIIYITLGVLAFYNALKYTETAGILWFSYTAFFLIGVGLLTRKAWLIASQLCIILIPYIIWNIDFFYILFTGSSLWGITDYFFAPRRTIAQLISLQHVFTIPVSLLAIYFIKLKRKDFWKFSAVQVVIFFLFVRIFGSVEENVNCAFENCLPFAISSAAYPLFWFFAYGVMITLTTFLLVNIKWFKSPK